MNKPYGYKKQDLICLAKLVANKGGKSLSKVFSEYALLSNKSKGTVRNIYYELIKYSQQDKEFTNAYLGGKPLTARKINKFDKSEEEWLVKTVKEQSQKGQSVRSIINQLAGGDLQKALRYQNKYRNIECKKPSVNGGDISDCLSNFPKTTLLTLKRDINALVDRITSKERLEKKVLLQKISALEIQNEKLMSLVAPSNRRGIAEYFNLSENKAKLND